MPELLPDTPADPVADAEAAVRAYARWHIAPSKDDVDTFPSYGGNVLLLKSLHVTDVTSVTIDGTEVDPETFDWFPNGVLRRADGWPCGRVVVEFTHGHDLADIADLYAVIRALASRGGAPGAFVQVGQVRVATDPSGSPLGGALSASERAVVDRYRLPKRP